jgi:hypothetical protein
MASTINLRPINTIIAEARDRAEQETRREIARIQANLDETIQNIERNRMVLPLLCEVVNLNLPDWSDGSYLSIDLGERPRTRKGRAEFAQKLTALRAILGQLRVQDRDVYSARRKLIIVRCRSEEFPSIQVRYLTKLPKNAKCRIECHRRTRYTTHCLVCPTD